jgi:membrane peptidoglycan carboxypeptidase
MDRTGTQVLYTLDNPGIVRKFLTVNPDAEDHFSLQLVRLVVAHLEPDFWTANSIDLQELTDPQPQTIAERLARELLIPDEEDSLRSALRMRLLANQLLAKYGRTQVLEWYLNSAYFGHLTYSAESASQLYLGKSASELDIAESTLLVSLITSPALNPVDAPTAAVENQAALLAEFYAQGILTPEEYNIASAEKLTFAPAPPTVQDTSSAFVELAREQLTDLVGATRVERGGLRVITTLDLDLQSQLICSARSQLFQIQAAAFSGTTLGLTDCPAADQLPTQSYEGDYANLAAGGVIMDPTNGQILAYSDPVDLSGAVMDVDYQPGSLLTPFVTLTAFARGSSPASLAWDVPMSLPTGAENESNPDGSFHGPVNYRIALANDYVAPSAGIFQQYDAQIVWSIATASGLSVTEDSTASVSLLFDGGQTNLMEMARAYAMLATNGTAYGVTVPSTGAVQSVTVLRVETLKGQTLVDNSQPDRQPIVSTSMAYLMNNILSDETARWTSLGHPNALEIGRPAAVKLGQVTSKSQVWTVGYTPQRLVLTWVGNQRGNTQLTYTDYRMSAGLWQALIKYTTQSLPSDDWSKPIDVTEMQVCSPSGFLPTSDCPNVTTDVFIYGNEPTTTDTFFQKAQVNRETGLLATVFTPKEMIEEDVFLNVPAAYRTWAINAGLAVMPLGYDAISMTEVDPNVQITSPVIFSPISGNAVIQGTANLDSLVSFNVQIGRGINPESWQQVGDTQTSPVIDGVLAEWDTTGLDGLYAVRLNVVTGDNQIHTSVIQVTVDNQAPQVAVAYPAAGAQVTSINGAVTLSANVTDTVGISRLEWWMDGELIAEQTSAPYSLSWQATKGSHSLQVKAWDTAGNETTSEVTEFEIIK